MAERLSSETCDLSRWVPCAAAESSQSSLIRTSPRVVSCGHLFTQAASHRIDLGLGEKGGTKKRNHVPVPSYR